MEERPTEIIWWLASRSGGLTDRTKASQGEERQHQRLGCRTNLRARRVGTDDSFAEQVHFPRFPSKRDKGVMLPFAHLHTTNKEWIRITSILNKPSSPEN